MAGALAVTLATACSDSTAPNDVTAGDLVGRWDATAATFTPDGGTPVDLLAGGSGLSLIVVPNSTGYRLIFSEPGSEGEVESGTMSFSAGVITFTPDPVDPVLGETPDPQSFNIVSLAGNTLTLSDPDAVEEDVTGTLRLVLQRQESVGD